MTALLQLPLPIPCAVARQDAAPPEAGQYLLHKRCLASGGAASSRAPSASLSLSPEIPRELEKETAVGYRGVPVRRHDLLSRTEIASGRVELAGLPRMRGVAVDAPWRLGVQSMALAGFGDGLAVPVRPPVLASRPPSGLACRRRRGPLVERRPLSPLGFRHRQLLTALLQLSLLSPCAGARQDAAPPRRGTGFHDTPLRSLRQTLCVLCVSSWEPRGQPPYTLKG